MLRQLKNQLAQNYSALVFSAHEAKRLDKDILPLAQEAFEKSARLYKQDQYTFLEFIDSQRVLFETQVQHIDALARYHQASIAIQRIVSPINLNR